MGYTVLTAESARQGLDLFTKNQVDAVILDYYLPDVDGGRLAKAMRLLKPEVPIILLSAQLYLPEEDIAAADSYVGKGQHSSGLLREIKHVLQRSARVQSA